MYSEYDIPHDTYCIGFSVRIRSTNGPTLLRPVIRGKRQRGTISGATLRTEYKSLRQYLYRLLTQLASVTSLLFENKTYKGLERSRPRLSCGWTAPCLFEHPIPPSAPYASDPGTVTDLQSGWLQIRRIWTRRRRTWSTHLSPKSK